MSYNAHLPCEPFVQPEDLPCCDGGYSLAEQGEAIELATEMLWMWTGRQFGVCTATLEPVIDAIYTKRIGMTLWPVTEVTQVEIDSEVLDPAAYHVEGYRTLVRTDGQAFWSKNEVVVNVAYGQSPPALVRRATARAACEFLNLWNNRPCGLPDRVTSVSRPGISMQVASAEDAVREGTTGIYEIDLAIKIYNPNGIQSRAMLYSPELGNRHRNRTS